MTISKVLKAAGPSRLTGTPPTEAPPLSQLGRSSSPTETDTLDRLEVSTLFLTVFAALKKSRPDWSGSGCLVMKINPHTISNISAKRRIRGLLDTVALPHIIRDTLAHIYTREDVPPRVL